MSEKSEQQKLIDMIRKLSPQVIAEELTSVQPMDDGGKALGELYRLLKESDSKLVFGRQIPKRFGVYEREPHYRGTPDPIILGPYPSLEEAQAAGEKYGYCGDNYYAKEIIRE